MLAVLIIIIIREYKSRKFSNGPESEALAVTVGGQRDKDVDGLFKEVSFQTVFEGQSLILRGSPFQTVGAK